MKLSDLEVKMFVLSDFQENAYVVRLKNRNDCVIIDPGLEPQELIEFLKMNRLTPQAILITHGHYDHIGGIFDLTRVWPDLEILISKDEEYKLNDPKGNLSEMFGLPMTAPNADRTLDDNEELFIAGMSFKVMKIPGHSCGHLVYMIETLDGTIVFVGDVIFQGSIGRTDFGDGNHRQLITGIREKLMTLPNKTVLLPGHGARTTVETEKTNNPFIS
ncbi:MAG: MBL fold metallo-hydrolase [Planctomycetia bacterium]|nr:MBL fold metallo-hydrolase [Planctomycetia bacterium]